MKMTVTKTVRAALRETTDGLTLEELSEMLGCARNNVRKVLKTMPDVYIDRWEVAPRRQYKAVWCVVIPPDNCPRPEGKS
jgi:DNA-binding transcriptional regulator GbsR (MarR family)